MTTTTTNTPEAIVTPINTGAELISATGAKVETEKITAGISDKNRIQLIEPSEVLEWMPKLQILENVTAKGITMVNDQYVEVEHPIDNNYKLAGHIDRNETFRACPWMKSEGYSETAHDFVLGSISDNLANRGLQHGIWRTNLTRNLGCMRTDILLKEYYKINEDAFEDGLGVQYNDKELKTAPSSYIPGDVGLYQPCVTVINSFFGASKVQFSLIRLLCLNGMHKIADSFAISFAHMQSNILTSFENKSDNFLDKIFAGKELENMIINMQEDQMLIATFLEWMTATAGPKATEALHEQYGMENNFGIEYNEEGEMVKGTDAQVSRWVAYNMMTWAASHMITNQLRQNRMYSQFQQLPSAK